MTIKAHCMGMEFPKRDTDGPNVKWIIPFEELKEILCRVVPFHRAGLPSAADLDAVAEEQRVKEATAHALELAGLIKEKTGG